MFIDPLKHLGPRIRHGRLTVCLPGGERHSFGSGTPHAEWYIHTSATLRRILSDPELMVGETYMNGEWDTSNLLDLLEVFMHNIPEQSSSGLLAGLLKRLLRQGNRIAQSYRNVAHHYDLDEWLFRRFLDRDMQYSCAYFYKPGISLEEAQRAKCAHILRKLDLSPGQQVLDIGCGWGGLALYLAEHAGVRVAGLTLSREQLRVAQQRARESGLQGRVEFLLRDYREHSGVYDRIVSVGMFEHVGAQHYPHYFEQMRRLLSPEGAALLHTIGRYTPPGVTSPWILKHIFPGGYIPALSELNRSVEGSGLITCDVETLRLHYAMTLGAWQHRFQAQRTEIAARLGERFCRMWEFYLAACEASFRWRDLVVFQLQLTQRLDVLPITRDYIYREEDRTHTAATVHAAQG